MSDEVDLSNTTVRVAVRMRPFSEKEIREGGVECIEIGQKDPTVTLLQEGQAPNVFAFDHVFGKESTQPQVFQTLGVPLLDKSFEGYNSTIFAYGQTGSGKTHTMMSDRRSDDRGLIPRIAENLFERIAQLTSDSRKFLVCCSFLEIYNEIVYDLLVPRGKNVPKAGLEIREGKGIGVYVKDLQEIVVDSSEKLQKLIDQGFDHRATAATQMNATSSRSHCLFIIKMHQKDEENSANNNFSKMNLVDLAGSERASRTGAQGDTLKEGANINKSLSALGNVINALSTMAGGSKKVFIPYRNSKLTRVLQESLGGNALTTMMAAISPSRTNAEETLSTLNYAKRAKSIKVNATKNEEAEQLAKLMEEVEALRSKLAQQASGVADTSRYEAQIEEMERFMKQTWEDKEKESQKHEEERKALEREAQKIAERAEAEKNKRFKLLEEKGDLDLTLQELKTLETAEGFSHTSEWHGQINRLIKLEQRVSAQCRAVALCKDAVMHDVDAWCERRRLVSEGGREEDGGAGGRMLLQQAERKAASMVRELAALEKLERELESEAALMLPQVRRISAIIQAEIEDEKKNKDSDEAKEGEEKAGIEKAPSEEFFKLASLVVRQLDDHRKKTWSQIAEDHKHLGNFNDRLTLLLSCCSGLGADTTDLNEDLKSVQSSPSTFGAEAFAACSRPLGLTDQEIPEDRIVVSSNKQAAASVRLFGGVDKLGNAFGGWAPVKDAKGEYVQVDLGSDCWVSAIGLQGRSPVNGHWAATRPLLAKVLEPTDPLPPERIFKRPPVRLIHDVMMAVHSRHKALASGKQDFTPEQLDYKQLQNADRQAKVDFFELLLSKTALAMKEASLDDKVPPIKVTPSEILGGKNTSESNRFLQILCYLGLRKKLGVESAGGLLDIADQWVTRFSVRWSDDAKTWKSFTTEAETVKEKPEPFIFDGTSNPDQFRYVTVWPWHPPKPFRYVRIHAVEWQAHPALRLEVYGWSASEADCSTPRRIALKDSTCRFDVVQRRSSLLHRCLNVASAKATEIWREAQKAQEEKNQQALAERSQVENQLQDALQQLSELRSAHNALEEKAADTEQRLIDAETEKLRLEVDRDRAETQVKTLEEKLEGAMQATSDEKAKVRESEEKCQEMKSFGEDLQQQIGVLTEERDCARAREEELFDTLNAKEEELMNTNEGYVYLTDQLNEVRDEYEEKVEQRDHTIETLGERNRELMEEGLNLRQEIGELRRKLADAEKALKRAEEGLPISFKHYPSSSNLGAPPATATTSASTPRSRGEADSNAYPGGERPRKEDQGEYEDDFDD